MEEIMERLKNAALAAQALVVNLQSDEGEDLMALEKEELVARLEALQATSGLTVAMVIRKFLEEPKCALLNYEQVAVLVQQVLPTAKTTSKTVASYASKQKEAWNIIPREKFQIDFDSLTA
jgi:hypothetical protein